MTEDELIAMRFNQYVSLTETLENLYKREMFDQLDSISASEYTRGLNLMLRILSEHTGSLIRPDLNCLSEIIHQDLSESYGRGEKIERPLQTRTLRRLK